MKPARRSLTPLDYAVMFGGPILFILIAVWGVSSFIGPAPKPNPIKQLRDGAVRAGMTEQTVIAIVGEPKSISEGEDGKFSYRYQRSVWNPDAKTFTEEDAYVDFGADGLVSSIAYESRNPDPPR